MNVKAEIKADTLVLPYNKHQPIRVFRNPKGDSLFIRARKHRCGDMWYASVNPEGVVPVDPGPNDRFGVIVFVPRPLQPGEGVLINRVLSSGNSANGSPVQMPDNWTCPMEIEFSKLHD